MRFSAACLVRAGLLCLGPQLAALSCFAQLELLPLRLPHQVFAGPAVPVETTWRNPGREPFDAVVRVKLFQASSATAVPVAEFPWKRLQVLPGQTVLESATLQLPAVRAETLFLLKWVAGSNTVLGTSELLAYPTNLLAQLGPLAGGSPLGVFDPQDNLKPLLKAAAVPFTDLQDARAEGFEGSLVVAGPFQNTRELRNGLAAQLKAMAAKGAALLWIQPPPEPAASPGEPLKPTFYTVPEGKGSVMVVQAALVDNPARNPQSQLNLLQLARLALHPEPPRLPAFAAVP
jgi:hypothetical protein